MCENVIIVTTTSRLRDRHGSPVSMCESDAEAVRLAEEIAAPGDPALVFIIAKKRVVETKGTWVTVSKGLGASHAGEE